MEHVCGKDKAEARTISDGLIGNLSEATFYPPKDRKALDKDKLLESIQELTTFINDIKAKQEEPAETGGGEGETPPAKGGGGVLDDLDELI